MKLSELWPEKFSIHIHLHNRIQSHSTNSMDTFFYYIPTYMSPAVQITATSNLPILYLYQKCLYDPGLETGFNDLLLCAMHFSKNG